MHEDVKVVCDGDSLQVGAHENGETCVAYTHETIDGALMNWAQEQVGTYLVLNTLPGRWKIRATINGREYDGYTRKLKGGVFHGERVHNNTGVNEG